MQLGIGIGVGLGLRFGGGGPATIPLPTANQTFRWRSDQFYTDTGCTTLATTNGANVKGQKDSSGNGNNGTCSSGNPLLVTNAFGTFPAAYHNGSSPTLTGSILGSGYNTAMTTFLVMKNFSTAGNQELFTTTSNRLYCANFLYRPVMTLAASGGSYSGPCEANAMGILAARFDGANVKMYWQSENCHGSKATALVNSLGLTGAWGLGNLVGGGLPGYFYEFEHILYQAALTDLQMTNAMATLMSYYGMVEKTKQVICVGDSLTWGYGSATNGYPEQLKTALGSTWGVANCGYSGATISSVDGYRPTDIAPLYQSTKSKNILIAWVGTNDIAAGTAGATVYSNYKTLCQAYKTAGFTVVASTIMKRTDFDASKETERGVFNTAVLAESFGTYFDARIDPGGNAGLQTPGSGANWTNGIHLSAAGYGVVAGLANTAVSGL